MIERINENNYEAFFLDYLEGNLAADQLEELTTFLRKHPDLKAELEGFELIDLPAEESLDSGLKAQLLREESTGLNRQDYLFISEVEGTIDAEEKEELALLLQQKAELGKELDAYRQTVLPAEEVVFAAKTDLIRKEGTVIGLWRYTAVAAAAILALVLFNINFNEEQYTPREFANKISTENPSEEKEIQYASIEVEEEQQVGEDITKSTRIPEVPQTQFASQEEKIQKAPTEIQPIEVKEEEITLAKKELQHNNADSVKQVAPLVPLEIESSNELADNQLQVKAEATPEVEYVPIDSYAREKIFKGKTFSETVMDELAEVSNNKITFEKETNEQGNTEKFALNIGKLRISKNK